MIKKLRRSPLYPLLARLYPALHGALIWWSWQVCFLLPVQKQKIIPGGKTGSSMYIIWILKAV